MLRPTLAALTAALVVTACGSDNSQSLGGDSSEPGGDQDVGASAPPAGSGEEGASGGASGTSSSAVGTGPADGGAPVVPQGQLTAGDFDDNLNFAFFQSYLARERAADGELPAHPVADRVVITVRDEGARAIDSARVRVLESGTLRFEGLTGADGRVLFLPALDGAQGGALTVEVLPPAAQAQVAPLTQPAPGGSDWELTLAGASPTASGVLDLAFVVDATGSMGDELDYLMRELQTLVDSVRASSPQLTLRLALVVYRDVSDSYLTRSFDFSTDLEAFRDFLGQQSASGGGDYPEAMEEALAAANDLSWSEGDATRLLFLVADAPPHRPGYAPFLAQVQAARGKGVRIYPVAASGVATQAEYLMRAAAQVTLGRYVWITDDSGIGAAHAEPHIPCYQVRLLVRVLAENILAELTGVRVGPPPDQVIREVGAPKDGVCTLQDGSTLRLR